MKRWTEAEDEELRDGVAPEGRSEDACAGRSQRKGEGALWRSAVALRSHLAAGGYIVRDEVGGAVGTRWSDATRSGLSFDHRHCQRQCADGGMKPLQDRPHVYARGAWR